MTGERSYYSDTRCSNQMEDKSQHWISPEYLLKMASC
jgi:hypothetical protein